jgi:adenine-specific DNA-methyltransferase
MSRKATASSLPLFGKSDTADSFDGDATSVILAGDSAETLKTLPDRSVKLIITSPPYNIGKAYEEHTRGGRASPLSATF